MVLEAFERDRRRIEEALGKVAPAAPAPPAQEIMPCPDREWLLRNAQTFLDYEGLGEPHERQALAERWTSHILNNWAMVWQYARRK